MVAGLVGMKRHDWFLIVLGGIGTAVSIKHFTKITKPHEDQFTQTFCPDWQSQIPPNIQSNLPKQRWQPLIKSIAHGPIEWNVPFGSNPDTPAAEHLYADIMHPAPNVKRSGLALIYVHGGGWTYGKRNIKKFPYFRQLSAQGHLVMDIDYTLSPKTSMTGMVKDVKRAIIWLKTNAERYHIDPARIVLAGQSAGGHLSLLAAYTGNYPSFQPDNSPVDSSVRAVISYYGAADIVALQNDIEMRFKDVLHSSPIRWLQEKVGTEHKLTYGIAGLVGGSASEIPEAYHLISPIEHVDANCPPTMLIHGTHDLLVDYQQATRLWAVLQQHHVPSIHIPLPRCEHSFESVLPRLSPSAQTAAFYMERFIGLMV